MKSLLIINSEQRDSGTAGSFKWSVNYYNVNSINNFRINKITIPYSYYNLKTQTFTISQNSGPLISIVFPAGNYTAQTLAGKLSSLINASLFASTLTINYLTDQNKFEFLLSSGVLTIDFLISQNVLGNYANYNLSYQLGFSQYNNLSNPPANFNGIIAPYTANLNATSNLYISCPTLNIYDISIFNRQRASIVQTIPVNTNIYGFIIWENSQSTIFPLYNTSLGQFEISLLDDYNNIIDLEGQNWIIEIELYK